MLDNPVIIDTINNAIMAYPVLLWGNLVSSFGTIPALLISFIIIVGSYTVGKTCIKWIIDKIKTLFKKREVKLQPQTM